MRVNVIRTDNPDMVMKMSLSGFQSDDTRNYFKTNYDNFVSRVGDHIDAFTTSVKNAYNYVTNNAVIDSAKRALTRADSVINDKFVYAVDKETIHNPGLVMRRYVMAQPAIHQKYVDNSCSGYDDEWEHFEQDIKPKLRTDYLQVMDGYVGENETIFLTEENPLSPRERMIVHDAWDTLTDIMASGIDPTDKDKGEI